MPAASLIDRYARQALSLLPPGRAITKRLEATVGRMVEGLAVEYARVHERAAELLEESVPGDADELLNDWEKVTGLPDCGETPSTTEERQEALVSKLVASGDQSDGTFEAIASTLGFTVTLAHKHLPATCTDTCTDPVAGIEWAFTKEVSGDGPEDKADLLKCRMRQHAHLYGQLIFDDGISQSLWLTEAGDFVVTEDGDRISL